jgi:signal transduction histidine kinase
VAIDARIADGRVVIDIIDQGIGLTREAMRDIFELFVQVNPTGVLAQGGLGIGLSLVRQLVELHGGEVTVHSEGLARGS